MAEITVRAAAPKDAAALAALCAALSAHEGQQPPAFTAAVVLRDGFGPARAFETLVAESQGDLLSYALFYPIYDTQTAARGYYVADLYVKDEARKQGLGRRLMAAVARRAKRAGGRFIAWNALSDNETARAFYNRIGEREARVETWSASGGDFDLLAES